MNWESFSEKHLSFLNKSYLDFALSEQESLGLFSISCFFSIFKLLKQPKFSASFLLPFGSYERKVSVSVQALSHVRLFATPWTEAHQASLSITNSRSLPKLTSIESVMPSNHLILCRPLFLLPFNPSQHQGLSNVSALCIRWPKYWSFSFNNSPSDELPGLISFRMD